MDRLQQAELRRLAKVLDQEPKYEALEVTRMQSPGELSHIRRYKIGDLVRVPRTSGNCSLGVIATQASPEGYLSVLVRSGPEGTISIKELDQAAIVRANPLKIGDFIQLGNTPFWVAGLDPSGEIQVLGRMGEPIDPAELHDRLVNQISDQQDLGEKTIHMTPVERDRLVRAREETHLDPSPRLPTERIRSRPLSVARPATPGPYVPIESILEANTSYGLIAGNKETETVYKLRSPLAGAALHTHRGHNYKSWNEDGGALFADADGRLYLGVFDQAGGEGSDENARGAASAIAARMLFDEMQLVAEEGGDRDQAEAALIRAAKKAHKMILARGKGEVTTYIGAMIDRDEAVIVNVGDSGAMHFSAGGKHVASTEAQGVGRLLLEGLGMVRKREFEHMAYRWTLKPGDHLVFGSDGLLDSRLSEDKIGKLIAGCETAAEATRKLRDEVSTRMKTKKGKPDNLTVLVVRAGES